MWHNKNNFWAQIYTTNVGIQNFWAQIYTTNVGIQNFWAQIYTTNVGIQTCADQESFARGGPTHLFELISGREGPNTTKSWGHYQLASESPFKKRFTGGKSWPSWNTGLLALRFSIGSWPVLLIKLYFCDFQGVGVWTRFKYK